MPKEECQPFRELLAAHALNALEPNEARKVESHLRSCDECQKLFEQYQAVGDGLAMTVSPVTPPPRVRAKLIAQLASRKSPKRESPQPLSLIRALVGAALVALLALNSFTLWQLTQVQRQQLAMQEQLKVNQQAMSLIAYPGARMVSIKNNGTSGTLVVNQGLKSGVLIVQGLAALEPPHVYQAWLIKADGARVSGGVFQADSQITTFVIVSPQPLSDFVGVGVTVEPAGGSPSPTGPRVLGVNF